MPEKAFKVLAKGTLELVSPQDPEGCSDGVATGRVSLAGGFKGKKPD